MFEKSFFDHKRGYDGVLNQDLIKRSSEQSRLYNKGRAARKLRIQQVLAEREEDDFNNEEWGGKRKSKTRKTKGKQKKGKQTRRKVRKQTRRKKKHY